MLEDMVLRVQRYSMMRVRNAHRARGDAVVRGALMLMHEANLVLSRGDRDCDFYDSSFIVHMIIFDMIDIICCSCDVLPLLSSE